MPWWSRWSGSTLVITATSGVKAVNEPSLSSASTTNTSPSPWCAPAPVAGQVAADGERRVEPAVLQRDGEHRRGRGLAVGAGDGRDAAARRQRGERLGAVHHRQPALPGGGELGVGLADRGGHDDGRVGRQVGRVVADVHPRTQRAQGERRPGSPSRPNRRPRRRGRAGCGRSRSSRRPRCRSGGPAPPVPARSLPSPPRRQAPAGPAARPRRRVPEARAALPAASSRAGSPSSGTSSASTRSPVSSASGTSTPPPAATTGSALSACSPLPCGSGTYTAGRPTADTSATVIAPARQSTASAAA